MQNYSVLMFDGSVKSVASLEDGDVLMGPDSAPRVIKNVETCEGEAFEVRPLNGESFILGDENYVCLQGVGRENCRFDIKRPWRHSLARAQLIRTFLEAYWPMDVFGASQSSFHVETSNRANILKRSQKAWVWSPNLPRVNMRNVSMFLLELQENVAIS
jgi:hypothetical protein